MAFPLDIAGFRAHFTPTFDTTPDALITAKLSEAEEEIDPVVWGTKAERGHAYLTAHLLAIDPGGKPARLATKDGKSTYGTEYHRLAKIVGASYRVVLD